MTDITIYWSGPSDASSGSTYKIERTTNNSNWSTLEATQAATSPYVSISSTLDGSHSYGDTVISLLSATSFSSSGFGWMDDALVEWTGKSTNDLTGVVWHSGYGTYTSGTAFREAHESYSDTGVSITLNAVLYRITHTNGDGLVSAPTYLWFYAPSAPASSQHCIVIVNLNADLGVEARAGIYVDAFLSASDFLVNSGIYLDAAESASMRQTANAFGLAFFNCFRSSQRVNNSSYIFDVDANDATVERFTIDTIPDRDWVLLADLV